MSSTGAASGYVALNINAEKEDDSLKSRNIWRVSISIEIEIYTLK